MPWSSPGAPIADDLRRWAERENVAPDASFRTLLPAPGALEAALAREARCTDAMFDAVGPEMSMAWSSGDGAALGDGTSAVPWHARRFVDMARERRMVRLWTGERLSRCAAAREDDVAYGACLRDDVQRELPKSVAVRAVALSPPESVARQLQAYRTWATPRP